MLPDTNASRPTPTEMAQTENGGWLTVPAVRAGPASSDPPTGTADARQPYRPFGPAGPRSAPRPRPTRSLRNDLGAEPFGYVVRAGSRIAAAGADGCSPRAEDAEQVVEILAQSVDDRAALTVGGGLDLFPLGPPRLGEGAAGQPSSLHQSFLGGVQVGLAPGAGPHVGA